MKKFLLVCTTALLVSSVGISAVYANSGVDALQSSSSSSEPSQSGDLSTPASVESAPIGIIDPWSKPVVVLGGGVTPADGAKTLSDLGIASEEDVFKFVANAEDMGKYLNITHLPTETMFSSVMVTKGEKGSGIKVKIHNPQNIQKVTETQYANAAITAGATDLKIDVISQVPVTGESALTGVYVAMRENGVQLDTERTIVAQEEINVSQQLNEAIAGSENADKLEENVLDKVLAEIKLKLAEYKDKNGEVASDQVVRDIVMEILKKYGLDKVISEDVINNLVTFATNFQNTSAIDSDALIKQLNSTFDGWLKGAEAEIKKAKESGFFEKVGNFIVGIFVAIAQFFWGILVAIFEGIASLFGGGK